MFLNKVHVEIERSLEHLTSLVVELYSTASLRGYAEFLQSPALEALQTRQAELLDEVEGCKTAAPEIFDTLEKTTGSRLEAGLGMFGVMLAQTETILMPEDGDYFKQTARQVGHAAMVLDGFRVFKLLREPDEETEPDEVEAQSADESQEAIEEPVDFEIHFEKDGELIINGTPINLLPAQKFVLEVYLMAEEPIKERDIYESDEFIALVKDLGQKSPIAIAYANALKALEGRLAKKLGLKDSFIGHVGGGIRRARLMQITSSFRVTDDRFDYSFADLQAIVEKETIEKLTNHIFDHVEIGKEANLTAILRDFYNLKVDQVLTTDQEAQRDQALKALVAELRSSNVSVRIDKTNDDDKIIFSEAPTTTGKKTRGNFVQLEQTQVIYENVIIPLTPTEQEMIKLIEPVTPSKGITKSNVRNQMQEAGYSITNFDREFRVLRQKLGVRIKSHDRKGSAYYYFNN